MKLRCLTQSENRYRKYKKTPVKETLKAHQKLPLTFDLDIVSKTPLLPPEVEGAPLKGTPGPKSSGKKDKDVKGGGKKGQEGKGGKGSKGDSSGDPSVGALRTTPWPPIEALACLVDVIATGDMPQVKARFLRAWIGLLAVFPNNS